MSARSHFSLSQIYGLRNSGTFAHRTAAASRHNSIGAKFQLPARNVRTWKVAGIAVSCCFRCYRVGLFSYRVACMQGRNVKPNNEAGQSPGVRDLQRALGCKKQLKENPLMLTIDGEKLDGHWK